MGRRKNRKAQKAQEAQWIQPAGGCTNVAVPYGVYEPKYENDLDGRFQWREGLPVEHLFEEEIEMINYLRQQVPQLQGETDKFIATFLFARRHDILAATKLLQTFYEKKASVAYLFPGQHTPSFKFSNLAELLSPGGQSMIQPRGFTDYKGRMIRHFIMEREHMPARTVDSTLLIGFWQTYYLVATEPLNAWRNGTLMVVDMKNAGFRNIDLSPKGKEILSSMQGIFPFRIREIALVNGGFVISALIAAARLVLPTKFMERIHMYKETELKNIIPPWYLLRHYGGEADYWFDEFLREFTAIEEELFARGIFQAPQQGAAYM